MAQSPGYLTDRKLYLFELIHCASHGSLCDLKSLMREEADLHTVDDDGSSLLHHAVSNPSTDVVKYLLGAGLSVDTQDNHGRTPLITCALYGRLENMWILISHGADIFARDKEGYPFIHYAALHVDSPDLLAYLIRKGVNIDEKNASGLTAFHVSVKHADVPGMIYLVREGANFSEPIIGGSNALFFAVLNPTPRAIQYLIRLGMDVNASDDRGMTPLHLCAIKGNLKNTKFLVDSGSDLTAVDKDGLTALHYAVLNEHTSDIIEYLLEQGAPADSVDKDGNTPLHRCAQAGNLKNIQVLLEVEQDLERKDALGQTALHHAAVKKNNPQILECLLNKGLSMDILDDSGCAAIHLCAMDGTLMKMQMLLRKGCDIDMKNADGSTPLACAIINENAREMIEYLLSEGAAINSQDKIGNLPLHHCARQGSLEITKFLVENGGDIRAKNANGGTALYVAVCYNTHELVAYLLSLESPDGTRNGSTHSYLLYCIKKGSLQNLKLLFDKGVHTQARDENGFTALHYAAANEHPGVVELVLDQGIPLEAISNDGATPLLDCAAQGTLENLRVLVEKGANVHAQDREGKTAMHYAVRNANSAAIVEFLLERGLSIEARDDLARTPLLYCALHGTVQSIKILIDKGASIKVKDDMEAKALHFSAANAKTTDIIEFLLDEGMLIDERDENDLTPLHHSIMSANVQNMKLLVQKGANVKARGKDNVTALHLAAVHGETTEILQYLAVKGAPIDVEDRDGGTPLLACAAHGNLQKMKLLVEKGANILARDEEGLSALHLAAVNKKTTDIIQYLMDKGIPLEVRDKPGRTPLLYSAANGNLQNVKFLCAKGADLKSVDIRKMTALHHAASNEDGGPIIEYLIAKGLAVDSRDELGLSPLLISQMLKIAENEKVLLKHAASRESLDQDGEGPSLTALMLAMMNQQM